MAITSEYNGFGLEWTEVVESFPNAIESDFGTNSKCGSYIIEREIERAEGILLSHFNQATLSILDQVPWHEVDSVTVDTPGMSGMYTPAASGTTAFEFDFAPDTAQPIRVYIAASSCSNGLGLGLCGESCGEFDICAGDSSLEQVEVFVSEDGDRYYGIIDRNVLPTERILLSYSVDSELFKVDSLAGIIRDIVCCQLGTALYSEGEARWGLVDLFCDNKSYMFDTMKNRKWLPGEFKALNFVNSVVPSGIMSVTTIRN